MLLQAAYNAIQKVRRVAMSLVKGCYKTRVIVGRGVEMASRINSPVTVAHQATCNIMEARR